MANQTYVTLNDGSRIPQFGLGVYMMPEGPETVNAVKDALGMGIRHIDTAHAYQNERSVGEGVRESGASGTRSGSPPSSGLRNTARKRATKA